MDPRQAASRTISSPEYAFGWSDGGRKLLLLEQTGEADTRFLKTSSPNATPACLIAAGQRKPAMMCTSGWRPLTGSKNFLDNERWTERVRRFAKAVKFHIPANIKDSPQSPEPVRENEGRYVACHAEKKLALFFLAQQMKFAGLSLEDALNGRLRDMDLPRHRRQAQIILGHKPCENCLKFLESIKRKTGISIRTKPCPVFVEHKRNRKFFRGERKASRAIETQNPAKPLDDDEDDDNEEDEEDQEEKGNKTHHDGAKDDGRGQVGGISDDDDVAQGGGEGDALDIAEAILADFPKGYVNHRGNDETLGPMDLDGRDSMATNGRRRCAPEPAIRQEPMTTARISVRSTPSPSIPTASVAVSTLSRGHRYPTYSTPARSGESAAPPSVWGGKAKPPATPCMEPPELWRAGSHASHAGGSNGRHDLGSGAPPTMNIFHGSVEFDSPSKISQSLSASQAQPIERSCFFETPSVDSGNSQAHEAVGEAVLAEIPATTVSLPLNTPISNLMPRFQEAGRSRIAPDSSIVLDDIDDSPDVEFLLSMDRVERQEKEQITRPPPPLFPRGYVPLRQLLQQGQQLGRDERGTAPPPNPARSHAVSHLGGCRPGAAATSPRPASPLAPAATPYVPPYLRTVQRRQRGESGQLPRLQLSSHPRPPPPFIDLTETPARGGEETGRSAAKSMPQGRPPLQAAQELGEDAARRPSQARAGASRTRGSRPRAATARRRRQQPTSSWPFPDLSRYEYGSC